MVSWKYLHRRAETSIFLIFRVDVVVGSDWGLLDAGTNVAKTDLTTNSVSPHDNGENVDAVVGESLLGAFSHAMAGRYDSLLSRWDDMSPIGVHSNRKDSSVVSSKIRGVIQTETGTVERQTGMSLNGSGVMSLQHVIFDGSGLEWISSFWRETKSFRSSRPGCDHGAASNRLGTRFVTLISGLIRKFRQFRVFLTFVQNDVLQLARGWIPIDHGFVLEKTPRLVWGVVNNWDN